MLPSGPVSEKVGFALCRVIVPLWVLSGALMKLFSATPKLLPKNLWTTALEWGINLYWLLAVLIVLEIFAVAVMVLLPRWARYMAIWMLSIFCLILIGEMLAGNDKCGCLGSFSPPPLVMLAIDATLLLGVILFRPPRPSAGWFPRGRLAATAVATLAGAVLAAAIILPENVEAVADGGDDGSPAGVTGTPAGGTAAGPSSGGAGSDATRRTGAAARPAYFGLSQPDSWVGRRFLETPLGQFVSGWPDDLEVGPRYVIFYSKSCDHCQELLETHFQFAPVPTTLVAIPEKKSGFSRDTWLDMQFCKECVTELELPTGTDWLMTPPIVIALAGGEITCLAEGDDAHDPTCLTYHP